MADLWIRRQRWHQVSNSVDLVDAGYRASSAGLPIAQAGACGSAAQRPPGNRESRRHLLRCRPPRYGGIGQPHPPAWCWFGSWRVSEVLGLEPVLGGSEWRGFWWMGDRATGPGSAVPGAHLWPPALVPDLLTRPLVTMVVCPKWRLAEVATIATTDGNGNPDLA